MATTSQISGLRIKKLNIASIFLDFIYSGRKIMPSEKLYFAEETLYRIGNGSSSRIASVRDREIDTIQINGIEVVKANGRGVSLYSREGLDLAPLSGWVWEIPPNYKFPVGLKLIKDDSPLGHYTVAPAANMPKSQFIGLLEQVALVCKKAFKKKA